MQIDTVDRRQQDISNHIQFLSFSLINLRDAGEKDTPRYLLTERLHGEAVQLKSLEKDRVKYPKGNLVRVKKSKCPELVGKVGRVLYVNTDKDWASVDFNDGEKARNLALSRLEIIDLPPLPDSIPASGMIVRFKNNPEEFVARSWEAREVLVELLSLAHSGRGEEIRRLALEWKQRLDLESVNGVAVPW
jgi:hypothetical protein